jgi:hypothetical protein
MAVVTDVSIAFKQDIQGLRVVEASERVVVGWRDASGTVRPIQRPQDVLQESRLIATGREICEWVNQAKRMAAVAGKGWPPVEIGGTPGIYPVVAWAIEGSQIATVRDMEAVVVGKRQNAGYQPIVGLVEKGDRLVVVTGRFICPLTKV